MIKIAYDPVFCHPLPEGHRFPMLKYELIPQQLMQHGIIGKEHLFSPPEVDEKWILLTHEEDYWQRLKRHQLSVSEVRRIGFPLTEELILRERRIVMGTMLCSDFAMQHGVSLNVAGGTHHAGSCWGEGFCLLNDIAIAANYLIKNRKVSKVLVVDLDVHQGNGTAEIFRNNDAVFTLSIHGEKNFPFLKEKSNLDIGLPDGIGDESYMALLEKTLPDVIRRYCPDFVFYQSGVDILNSDKLGKLSITKEGCAARDEFVFEQCRKNGLPVAVTMGGGYSERLADIVDAHCATFQKAFEIFGH